MQNRRDEEETKEGGRKTFRRRLKNQSSRGRKKFPRTMVSFLPSVPSCYPSTQRYPFVLVQAATNQEKIALMRRRPLLSLHTRGFQKSRLAEKEEGGNFLSKFSWLFFSCFAFVLSSSRLPLPCGVCIVMIGEEVAWEERGLPLKSRTNLTPSPCMPWTVCIPLRDVIIVPVKTLADKGERGTVKSTQVYNEVFILLFFPSLPAPSDHPPRCRGLLLRHQGGAPRQGQEPGTTAGATAAGESPGAGSHSPRAEGRGRGRRRLLPAVADHPLLWPNAAALGNDGGVGGGGGARVGA